MIKYGIEVKVSSRFSELKQALFLPVADLTTNLAAAIRLRVSGQGMGADMSALPNKGTVRTTTGRSRDPSARWWVSPDHPQPNGWMQRVDTGDLAGWAVYRSYEDFLSRLDPIARRLQAKRTGELWESLRVRMMAPNRAKATFYGGRKTSKNAGARIAFAQIATLAARGLKHGLLQYSAKELQETRDDAQEMLTGAMRARLLGAAAAPVRTRLRGVQGTLRR